jgi:beta-mannosidase
MHYMARRFYAPILVTARESENEFIVSAVDDLPTASATHVDVQAISVTGKAPTLYNGTVQLTGNGQEITRVDLSSIGNDHILFITWTDEHGRTQRSHAAPVPYKHLALPSPVLTSTITEVNGSLAITVTAQHLALYVALECDVAGHFSDSAFDLLGGESTTITFTPDTPSDLQRAESTLVIRDLYSSSHTTH